MKNLPPLIAMFALGICLALPLPAEAHRSWILPTSSVLAGESPWTSFDAASSNDIFHADHRGMPVENLRVMAPDGSVTPVQNATTGRLRTSFDVQLTQPGTWKVFVASSGLNARWEENGQRKSWPPRGVQATPEAFAKEVPAKADKLNVSQSSRRIETFVTRGKPSALTPTGSGLEMVPVTHPNDLVAGEPAVFRFLIDGQPAAGAKIELVPGARRYRNDEAMIELTADKDGRVSVSWPAAGTYWLEASYEDDKAPAPATKRTGLYVATFEVLPD
ncbi:MAG: DUF4198 domain-containing protein [Moraxellaceae bacterium]|nr:DUF4198 domain-containing protein [Moraxellaceae bacterium]